MNATFSYSFIMMSHITVTIDAMLLGREAGIMVEALIPSTKVRLINPCEHIHVHVG